MKKATQQELQAISNQSGNDCGLPLTVQVAFAGARTLFDSEAHPVLDKNIFQQAVRRLLKQRLALLPADLGLSPHHRVCGISALAGGADTCFTQACLELEWPQRLFLPQPKEEFLSASDAGVPDFSTEDALLARALFKSPHVIEERVISFSKDRRTRFEDVNLELVRVSDVLVCLLRAGATDKPGGTLNALAIAARRNRVVLEIQVNVDADEQPVFTERWHRNLSSPASTAGHNIFQPPGLPAPLDEITSFADGLDDPVAYNDVLNAFAREKAKDKQSFFTNAALVIVCTHIIATAFALRVVQDIDSSLVLLWLLGGELSLLATGILYHEWLHRSRAASEWALCRLASELARSCGHLAASRVPRPLSYLFELPMPDSLRPLLHSLNVLHLRGLQSKQTEWQERRNNYVKNRLQAPNGGQVDYYEHQLGVARLKLLVARMIFYTGSFGALLATFSKILIELHRIPLSIESHDLAIVWLGYLAVLLPAIAVAALSLAAAFDLEARSHIYADMLAFLREQIPLLQDAASENEFAVLVIETEARLLGETANWYARRAFTGVA